MGFRLLDGFCGAGGASAGYHRAGLAVTGLDIARQPHYPFEFMQADFLALDPEWIAANFDAVHISPVCKRYSATTPDSHRENHPDQIGPARELVKATGLPYVIENVRGAPLIAPVWLCGTEFGLTTVMPRYGQVWLSRHRGFEANFWIWGAGGCSCHGKRIVGVYGNGAGGPKQSTRGPGMAKAAREVMGIDWMTRAELDQSLPPAYTEFIGGQLRNHLETL